MPGAVPAGDSLSWTGICLHCDLFKLQCARLATPHAGLRRERISSIAWLWNFTLVTEFFNEGPGASEDNEPADGNRESNCA